MKRAAISRNTTETQIDVRLRLDGRGRYRVDTGIRFLDHMLELVARHGGFDLDLTARGDLDVDQHHLVEDTGIALGEAVAAAIGLLATGVGLYALYLALSVSVELQNAAFLCIGRVFGVDVWICDLAAHDPTYVLPVLMGVTMFVQQKMTPVMGDPRQAKMMLVMPFVFTIMFVNLPSGLVLYWTVSNVLQILQQWYMDRPRAKAPARELKDASDA